MKKRVPNPQQATPLITPFKKKVFGLYILHVCVLCEALRAVRRHNLLAGVAISRFPSSNVTGVMLRRGPPQPSIAPSSNDFRQLKLSSCDHL